MCVSNTALVLGHEVCRITSLIHEIILLLFPYFRSSLSSYISSDASSSEQWGHTPFTIFLSFIILATVLSNFALLPTVFKSDVELPANVTFADFFVNPFRGNNSISACDILKPASVVVMVTWWCVNSFANVDSSQHLSSIVLHSSMVKPFTLRFLAVFVLVSMVPVANTEASNHTMENLTCSWADMPVDQLCSKSESPLIEICEPTPFHTPLPFLPNVPDYIRHGPTSKQLVSLTPKQLISLPKQLVSLTQFHSKFPTDHLGGVGFVAVSMGIAVLVCPVPLAVVAVLILLVYSSLLKILRAETRHAAETYLHFVTVVVPNVFERLTISADVVWRGILFILNIFTISADFAWRGILFIVTYAFNVFMISADVAWRGILFLLTYTFNMFTMAWRGSMFLLTYTFNVFLRGLITLFNTTLNRAMLLFSHGIHYASVYAPLVLSNFTVNVVVKVYFSIIRYILFVLTPFLMQLCLDLTLFFVLLLMCGVVSAEAASCTLPSIFTLTLGVVTALHLLRNLIGRIRLFLPAKARHGHAPVQHNAPIRSAYIQPTFGPAISNLQLLISPLPLLHVIAPYEISGEPVTSTESEGGLPTSYEHSLSHDSGILSDYGEDTIPNGESGGHQRFDVRSTVALVEREFPYSCAYGEDGELFLHFEDQLLQPIQEENR